MFASHKPRVHRSSSGCCICRSKSSSSRFATTEKYESLFTACFGVEQGSRTGFICNACVLVVKRWQKLPEENKRSCAHVVDKSVNCEGARGDLRLQTRRRERKVTKKSPQTDQSKCDSRQKSKDQTKKTCESSTSPTCSSTSSDISETALSLDGRTSTACQTSFFSHK